jgi:hypothetical protein
MFQNSTQLGPIGNETEDPPCGSVWANTEWGSCNGQVYCRRVDAALFSANYYNVSDWDIPIGRVARPLCCGSTNMQYGAIRLDPLPYFVVTGEVGDMYVGQELDKVGRTSGWTYGKIDHVCMDTRFRVEPGDGNPTDKPIVFRCQTYVRNALVLKGDRGGWLWPQDIPYLVSSVGIRTRSRVRLAVDLDHSWYRVPYDRLISERGPATEGWELVRHHRHDWRPGVGVRLGVEIPLRPSP